MQDNSSTAGVCQSYIICCPCGENYPIQKTAIIAKFKKFKVN